MTDILRICILLASALVVTGFAWTSAAGQIATPTPVDETIKVNTVLLNVPLIVSDRSGKHVSGLRAEDFKVTFNDRPHTVDYFSDTEMALTVAIVLDVSGSVTSVIGGIRKAAKQFVDQLGPEDRAMVVTFGEHVTVRQPFSNDKGKLKSRIEAVQATSGGSGLMNQAVLQVVRREFADVKGRKAVILLTDAGEINPASTRTLVDELIEGDTVVYPIFYLGSAPWMRSFGQRTFTMAELIAETPVGRLDDIAKSTGGRLLLAHNGDFTESFQTIADELKKMYVIGFYPEGGGGGKPDRVDIRVNRADVFVTTKRTIRAKSSRK